MDLELRHLRVICAIADAGSVSRAATVLGYSQQAMSTQLRRLEAHFGRPLFERNSGGVEPTAYGAEIVTQARDLLARAESLGRTARGDGSGQRRQVLRFAATNTPVLAGMASRVRDRRPDVTLTVSSVYSTAEIVNLLDNGEIDAGIAADYPGLELQHSDAIAHRAIATEPSFVALPTNHRLKHNTEVALSDLADEAWFLTPDDGAGWPGIFFTACAAAGFQPKTIHEFIGDHGQLQSMIAEGLGISLVQATTQPIAPMIIKPLAGAPIWCRYVLAWSRLTVADDLAETLFTSCVAAYRERIAKAPHFQSWSRRIYSVERS